MSTLQSLSLFQIRLQKPRLRVCPIVSGTVTRRLKNCNKLEKLIVCMLFRFILLIYGKAINLSSLSILREFEGQCRPRWSFVDSPFKLSQLIVAFRHGSRAPLKTGGPQWKSRECKVCTTECETVDCQEGMLTLEGFDQSKELGRFIDRFYVPRLSSLREIQGFYSKIGRTLTTLNGVIQGMGFQGSKARVEGSLVNNPNSVHVKSILINKGSIDVEKSGVGNYYVYDNMITSLCSNTPFDCSRFDCRPEKIYDLMRKQESQFIESIEKTRTNLTANGVSLGRFGSFLEKIIFNRNSIVLISGHDSTLVKLLIGLGIKLDRIPAYSSAVFLEVWKQSDGKEYVRVVYEGKVQKIGLYKEEYVEAEKFKTYLAMFNRLNDTLDNSTGINSESVDPPGKINEIAQSATKIYKPLLEELKNRDIIQDSSLISEIAAGNQQNIFKNLLSSFIVPVKQFLFGGWFGSKKNETKNNKIEIKIETKDKDTGEKKYQVIECDKDGEGSCRTLSKANSDKKNRLDESDKLDRSSPKRQEACPCEASKSHKCEQEKEACSCKDKCRKESTSCQVKEMLEHSCNVEEPQCGTAKIACNSKPLSAFDGLPGTCKAFSGTCEAHPPACPRENQLPILSDGRCRSPIPGVEILE